VPFARDTTTNLADAIRRNPQRLGGFAALPSADPAAAADELERVVRDHEFVGAKSTGIARAGVSMTSSSGRFWSAPKRRECRSICTRRVHHSL
jgi:hypothetical protein